jgi:murein DD-endopeptidase MepM/ murein hydrolase activator NlpD
MITPAQPPEGILDPQQPWWPADRVGPQIWLRLKGKLTGRPIAEMSGERHTSYVKLGDADADRLIENIKKYGQYPQVNQNDKYGGAYNAEAYQEWLVEEFLEKPFREQVNKKIEERAVQKATPLPQLVEVVAEEPEDKEEVQAQVETAVEVLEEAEKANEQQITEDLLSDLPVGLQESLINVINKKTGANLPKPDKPKTSSSNISNRKIYNFLSSNIYKIQSQLDGIDQRLQEQNALLRSTLGVTTAIYSSIENQDNILDAKLDAVLEAFEKQNELAKELADKQENAAAEAALERQRKGSGTEGFIDVSGSGGSGGLLGLLGRFFGKKLGRFLFKRLWKMLPKGLRSRARLARMVVGGAPRKLKQKLATSIASKLTQKVAQKTATAAAPRAVVKGFEHIALPGVTRNIDDVAKIANSPAAKQAFTNMLGPINKAAISQLTEPKSGFKIALSALNNKKVQEAITKKGGKELLEKVLTKLGIKVGGQAVPAIGQALNLGYGVVEAITRTAMGDPKGGLLSLGGAIPLAGAGFSVIDIIRDIDIEAYTRHIEPNLGKVATGDGQPVAAFFNEIVGQEMQYETGSRDVRPGTAMLHGTEWVGTKNEYSNALNAIPNTVGSNLVTTTSSFLQALGPAGSNVARELNRDLAFLSDQFGMSAGMTTPNIGGSFPPMESSIEKLKSSEGGGDAELEGLSSEEKDIFKSSGQTFKERLMGMFEDKFKKIKDALAIRTRTDPGGPGPGPYTGPVSGETFNPLPGGIAGAQSGQRFGDSRGGRDHAGIDITEHKLKDSRAPIVSYKTGKVIKVERDDKYPGGGIEVDHGGGLITRYLHVTPRSDMKVGDTVYGGQEIGKLHRYYDGNTEATHLHFEVYQNNKLMNPTDYVRGAKNNISSPLSDDRAKSLHMDATAAAEPKEPLITDPDVADVTLTLANEARIGVGQINGIEYFYSADRYWREDLKSKKIKQITEAEYKSVRNKNPNSFGLQANKSYTLPSQHNGEIREISSARPQAPDTRNKTQVASALSYDVDEQRTASEIAFAVVPTPVPTAAPESSTVQYVPTNVNRNYTAARLGLA